MQAASGPRGNDAGCRRFKAGVPAAWQVDQPTRNALADFLVKRAAYVAETLPGSLWPPTLQQPELKL
jgi:hypothetical protein